MKKKHHNRLSRVVSIWVAVVFLLVLVVASVALLSTMLRSWPVAGEKNVVSLLPAGPDGFHVYETETVPATADPDVNLGNTGGNGSGSAGGNGSSQDPTYENGSSFDLFKDTYVNEKGEIIAQSGNGDKIIAPGTHNDYYFSIKNTGNISLDYTLELVSDFTFREAELPIVVRLSKGNEYFIGSADQWIPWKDMHEAAKGLDTVRTLPSGASDNYLFEWQWPLEIGKDIFGEWNQALADANNNKDTNLGSLGSQSGTNFSLDIKTNATVTEGAVPVDGSGNTLFTNIFKRLDVTYVGIWIILIVMATLGLIGLFIYFIIAYLREKEEEPKPVPPPPPPAPIPVPVPEPEPEPEPEEATP